MKLEGSLPSS